MIVDAALRHDEPALAADMCDRLVGVLPKAKGAAEAQDVAWRRCNAVGASASFPDLDRRLRLLGRAMLLAPEIEVTRTLLPAWRLLEKSARDGPTSAPGSLRSTAPSVGRAGTEAAARAARSLGKAATGFLRPLTPSGDGEERMRTPSPSGMGEAGHHSRFGVRSTLSKGFSSGVGWLIGVDEQQQGA